MQSAPHSAESEITGAPPAALWRLWTLIAALALATVATALVRLFQGSRPSADLTLTSALVAVTTTGVGALS